MINNHKAKKKKKKWRIHSGNTIIERKIQGEFKVQLTMLTNFISSIPRSFMANFSMPDSDKTSTMLQRLII